MLLPLQMSGIWCDMNEPALFNTPDKTLPELCRHGSKLHAEMHNLYGYLMCKVMGYVVVFVLLLQWKKVVACF